MKTDPIDRRYSVKEMAKRLKISPSYVRTIIYTQAVGITGIRESGGNKGGQRKTYSSSDYKKIESIVKSKGPVGRPRKGKMKGLTNEN